MNVSAEFKLEPPFKVLNVRFIRILTRDDDLLGLEVLDVDLPRLVREVLLVHLDHLLLRTVPTEEIVEVSSRGLTFLYQKKGKKR